MTTQCIVSTEGPQPSQPIPLHVRRCLVSKIANYCTLNSWNPMLRLEFSEESSAPEERLERVSSCIKSRMTDRSSSCFTSKTYWRNKTKQQGNKRREREIASVQYCRIPQLLSYSLFMMNEPSLHVATPVCPCPHFANSTLSSSIKLLTFCNDF